MEKIKRIFLITSGIGLVIAMSASVGTGIYFSAKTKISVEKSEPNYIFEDFNTNFIISNINSTKEENMKTKKMDDFYSSAKNRYLFNENNLKSENSINKLLLDNNSDFYSLSDNLFKQNDNIENFKIFKNYSELENLFLNNSFISQNNQKINILNEFSNHFFETKNLVMLQGIFTNFSLSSGKSHSANISNINFSNNILKITLDYSEQGINYVGETAIFSKSTAYFIPLEKSIDIQKIEVFYKDI